MTRETIVGTPRLHLMQSMAAAICPPGQRHWVHAMFAELAAIDGPGRRITWMLGAGSIVCAATQARAVAVLSLRIRIALVVALGAALVSGILSYVDVQAVVLDDELLAVLSVAAAAALVGLAANAGRKIFRTPELAPGEGR